MGADRILVVPSILASNLARLQEEVQSIEPYADGIQVDVMDGHFVPNLTFGAPLLRDLRTTLPLDIHLMVKNPEDRIAEFLALRVSHITFHAEAVEGTAKRQDLIQKIHRGGATAGIALNPETPVSAIEDVAADVDLVLVMSVRPGFAGQTFLSEVLPKVQLLRERFPKTMIQMDGGIDAKTAPRCREAGAQSLVAASFIFEAKDRERAIAILRGDA